MSNMLSVGWPPGIVDTPALDSTMNVGCSRRPDFEPMTLALKLSHLDEKWVSKKKKMKTRWTWQQVAQHYFAQSKHNGEQIRSTFCLRHGRYLPPCSATGRQGGDIDTQTTSSCFATRSSRMVDWWEQHVGYKVAEVPLQHSSRAWMWESIGKADWGLALAFSRPNRHQGWLALSLWHAIWFWLIWHCIWFRNCKKYMRNQTNQAHRLQPLGSPLFHSVLWDRGGRRRRRRRWWWWWWSVPRLCCWDWTQEEEEEEVMKKTTLKWQQKLTVCNCLSRPRKC